MEEAIGRAGSTASEANNMADFNEQTLSALRTAHENVDTLLTRARGAQAEKGSDRPDDNRNLSLMEQSVIMRDGTQSLNVKLAELARYLFGGLA